MLPHRLRSSMHMLKGEALQLQRARQHGGNIEQMLLIHCDDSNALLEIAPLARQGDKTFTGFFRGCSQQVPIRTGDAPAHPLTGTARVAIQQSKRIHPPASFDGGTGSGGDNSAECNELYRSITGTSLEL